MFLIFLVLFVIISERIIRFNPLIQVYVFNEEQIYKTLDMRKDFVLIP